jgi:hypothetical protein
VPSTSDVLISCQLGCTEGAAGIVGIRLASEGGIREGTGELANDHITLGDGASIEQCLSDIRLDINILI